jgi:hypothetical protein
MKNQETVKTGSREAGKKTKKQEKQKAEKQRSRKQKSRKSTKAGKAEKHKKAGKAGKAENQSSRKSREAGIKKTKPGKKKEIALPEKITRSFKFHLCKLGRSLPHCWFLLLG